MLKKKKLLFIAILPGILLAVLALSLLFISKKSTKLSENSPGIVSEPNANGEVTATVTAVLYKESGHVLYTEPGKSAVELTDSEVKVVPGTDVATTDGLAHVIFPNNSMMSIAQNSEVTITFEEANISVVQIIGSTWHRVEKVLQGNTYTVETPTTLATVRGTVFGVDNTTADSQVMVTESVVDVAQIEKKGTEKIIRTAQKVAAGKQIDVPKTAVSTQLAIKTIPPEAREKPWFKRNEIITQEIKKQESQTGADQVKKEKIKLEVIKKVDQEPEVKVLDKKLLETSNLKLNAIQKADPSPTPNLLQKANTILNSDSTLKTTILIKPNPSPSPKLQNIISNTETLKTIIQSKPSPSPTPALKVTDTIKLNQVIQAQPSPAPTPATQQLQINPNLLKSVKGF